MKINIFGITFVEFGKTVVMKNKYFLLFIFVACITSLTYTEPVGESDAGAINNEIIFSIANSHESHPAILHESDINFSTGTIKLTNYENTKTHEKQVKYKLPVKENRKMEYSIENYIFFIEALTYHHSDLNDLRRLNI